MLFVNLNHCYNIYKGVNIVCDENFVFPGVPQFLPHIPPLIPRPHHPSLISYTFCSIKT